MKTTAVICEYNPFHNGHEYMLKKLREEGSDHIAAIMSGSFTQRGEAAVFDKYSRTKAALAGGADIVIELPVSFACANAERFAFGGAYIAQALGVVDELAFGSETGDTQLLKTAADAVDDERVRAELSVQLAKGMTFAAARQKAVEEIFGAECSEILSQPNDILGIEYIRALKKLGSGISVRALRRTGASHDSEEASENIASAKAVRSLIYREDMGYERFIPEYAAQIFSQSENQPPPGGRMAKLEQALLYRLRTMTAEEISLLPEISEGLENRIYSSVKQGCTAEEIISSIKSKRYTRARIARILTYALLGFRKRELPEHPGYIRILGMNQRGRELLRMAGKSGSSGTKLPVVIRYSEAEKHSAAKRMFLQESECDDIYALSGKSPDICGRNFTTPLIVRSER